MELTRVTNVNHRFGKDAYYYHLLNVEVEGEGVTDLLLTQHVVRWGKIRSYMHREDLPVAPKPDRIMSFDKGFMLGIIVTGAAIGLLGLLIRVLGG